MPAPTPLFPEISRPSFLKVTYPFFHNVDQLQEEVREDEGQVHLSCGHSGAPAHHQSQQANQRCKYRSQEPVFSGSGAFAQEGAIVDCLRCRGREALSSFTLETCLSNPQACQWSIRPQQIATNTYWIYRIVFPSYSLSVCILNYKWRNVILYLPAF